ncbi:MAG: tetratricopeptide repeat protein, partial [Nitrospira sp.]|nr:tetratricopeptide repeat protein [Nitrospira sp.]
NLKEALSLIKQALDLKPEEGAYVDSLGWVYYRLGRLDEALEQLKKAVSLVPDDAVILEHLGEVYLKKGLRKEARELWLRSLEADPNNQLLADRFRKEGFGDPETEERIQRAKTKASQQSSDTSLLPIVRQEHTSSQAQ